MKKYSFHLCMIILYSFFTYMVIKAFQLYNGHVQIYELQDNVEFKTLRAVFFIFALGMTFICLIKFLYDVNKKNFIHLIITSFPIGIALIYIILHSIFMTF